MFLKLAEFQRDAHAQTADIRISESLGLGIQDQTIAALQRDPEVLHDVQGQIHTRFKHKYEIAV